MIKQMHNTMHNENRAGLAPNEIDHLNGKLLIDHINQLK